MAKAPEDFDITTKRDKEMRKKKMMNKKHYIKSLVMLAAMMLTGCGSGSDGFDDGPQDAAESPQEIRLKADVWQVMEGTRATTYDGGTLSSGSFTAAAYVENTTTAYISPVQVDYTSQWEWSDGKHYWPASGNLDFFAYMPAEDDLPDYISSGPTYSVVESTPQATFTCTDMPMTYDAPTSTTANQGSDLQEFVWGITVGQNKASQGASGVTMKFRHPFARIRFQLAASHPDIQINSITFKSLKTGGTCTLDATDIAETYYYTKSTWSSLTPADGTSNLVMTLAGKDSDGNWVTADVNTFNSNPASVVPIGGWDDDDDEHQYVNLLVVPQTFAGEIEVNASWNDWGDTPVAHTVSTTITSVTWQAGYSYTYTFYITPEDLTVDVSNFTEQW